MVGERLFCSIGTPPLRGRAQVKSTARQCRATCIPWLTPLHSGNTTPARAKAGTNFDVLTRDHERATVRLPVKQTFLVLYS
jgi:hypothetical protein